MDDWSNVETWRSAPEPEPPTPLAMTNQHHLRVPEPGLEPVSGEQELALRSETNYRDLERGYRQSEQCAWMQKQYPQLRFWITHCHPADLVGGDSIKNVD